MNTQVRLRQLLGERHWQKYATFCREYDRAALAVDPALVGTHPSRAQLHRWTSGQMRSLPYPDARRVLERMFPGWTAEQLFETVPDEPGATDSRVRSAIDIVARHIDTPDAAAPRWGAGLRGAEGPAGQLGDPGDRREPGAVAEALGRSTLALAKALRLTAAETEQIAELAGNVVDLDLQVDIDIGPDGRVQVVHRHHLFNLSRRPLTRLAREIWFKHVDGPLMIEPVIQAGQRQVGIQRVHDTAHGAKFACQLSPPLQPGDSTTISYACTGGVFADDFYWRASLPRYTRHVTIRVRHRDVGQLTSCTAVEEHPDGAENTATEDLLWDYEGRDALITLVRNYLRPNQAVTLRWEIRDFA